MKDFTQTNQTQAIKLLNAEVALLREDLKWANAEIPALKKVIRELRLFNDPRDARFSNIECIIE